MPPKSKAATRATALNATRTATRSKPPITSPDELATTLATKLTLTESKGKAKASGEEARNQAMRDVNSASKSFSAAIELGWKHSYTKKASKPSSSTLSSAAFHAAQSLSILRRLSPGDIDIERAASSLIGKLVALELVRSS